MMDEREFALRAERELGLLEQALEAAAEQAGADVELEVQPGGILALEFSDGSQMVINRHLAAREIWVAARAGGFHFRLEGERWVDTRSGAELWERLAALVSAQAGEALVLERAAAQE